MEFMGDMNKNHNLFISFDTLAPLLRIAGKFNTPGVAKVFYINRPNLSFKWWSFSRIFAKLSHSPPPVVFQPQHQIIFVEFSWAYYAIQGFTFYMLPKYPGDEKNNFLNHNF